MTYFSDSLIRSTPATPSFSIMPYLALYRERRALAQLSVDQLEDIGVSRAQATIEARKPIWSRPANR